MSSTKFLKLKKATLTYYSLANERRYNDKSKENLVQFQNEINKEDLKELKDLQNIDLVDCINKYSAKYLLSYEEIKNKKYKNGFSITQQKKIADSTNTFIDVVKHNYKKSSGLNQRMITFVTLTIPENQKHTDKILVKTLVDFIDHLKKVKNTIVKNKIDTGEKIMQLENYVWRAETTEIGNIHFHLLFDCYVNHTTLKRVWNNYLLKLGYTGGENGANIHNLKNINDVGGYITKYLTKDPLNNKYTDLLKEKKITREQLSEIPNNLKYRRPILYVSWGCSRPLKKLSAPTFTGSDIFQFSELRDKCKAVELPDEIKDFVKIYKGKIYDLLNSCSFNLKKVVKDKFKFLYSFIYEKSEDYRKNVDELIWLHRQNFSINDVFQPFTEITKTPKPFIPNLF